MKRVPIGILAHSLPRPLVRRPLALVLITASEDAAADTLPSARIPLPRVLVSVRKSAHAWEAMPHLSITQINIAHGIRNWNLGPRGIMLGCSNVNAVRTLTDTWGCGHAMLGRLKFLARGAHLAHVACPAPIRPRT